MKLPALLLLAAALPACAADEPAPQFAPVMCGLAACVDDVDAPIALAEHGVLALSVSAVPGEGFTVRATDPALVSMTVVGYGVDVLALAPGPVDLELLDAEGDVVDSVELTVLAPDRLTAHLRWVEDGVQVTSVADDTIVPANAAVGITVTPSFRGFPLAGLIDYEIESSLPAGASLDTSGLSEAILLMRTGEHIVTYRTGSLEERFVLSTDPSR